MPVQKKAMGQNKIKYQPSFSSDSHNPTASSDSFGQTLSNYILFYFYPSLLNLVTAFDHIINKSKSQ